MNKATGLALFVLIWLTNSGCSSLRPPAPDRQAYLDQQQEKEQMTTQERAMWDAMYYVLDILGSFAANK